MSLNIPQAVLYDALNRALKAHVARLYGGLLDSDDADRLARFELGVRKGLAVYEDAMRIVTRITADPAAEDLS